MREEGGGREGAEEDGWRGGGQGWEGAGPDAEVEGEEEEG